LCRPVLTRGETIDSCCSDDLVTVLEIKVEKKPFKVTDRVRLFRKGIMAANLGELRMKGTQLMKDNTMLMLLFKDDIWTPYGQPAS
jgi:hypothetical protein